MRRLCPWCKWQYLLPVALALSLLGMLGGCGLVERDLTSRTKTALTRAGVDGVGVDYDYRNATLRGPEGQRTAALAAATGLDGVREATYVATGGEASAPVEAPSVDVRATYDGSAVTLTGEVASDAQRDMLVAAATAKFGAANVTDNLTIAPGGTTAALDAAVATLPAIFTRAKADMANAEVHLADTNLTVSGAMRQGASLPLLNSFIGNFAGQGLNVSTDISVSGSVAAPPAARPKVVSAKLASILAASTITFETASATITDQSFPTLDRVVQVLRPAVRANPKLRVSVQGHTDDRGATGANQLLSERRARAVLQYLTSKGVPATRLGAVGFGESKPVATNATDAGRRTNRRIEFKVGG